MDDALKNLSCFCYAIKKFNFRLPRSTGTLTFLGCVHCSETLTGVSIQRVKYTPVAYHDNGTISL